MSARPPATRDALELPGGLFHLRQDRSPPPRGARQRQTRRKPGTQSPEATTRRSRVTPVEPPQPFEEDSMRSRTIKRRVLALSITFLLACHIEPRQAVGPNYQV